MHPLAPSLDGVRASHDRDVVLDLGAPDQLVDSRLKKERAAEPECRPEAHAGVGSQVRCHGGPRPVLARVGEVRLVQYAVRERGDPVQVADVDAGRVAFDAVRRGAVGRHVEGLVLLPGVVEVPRRGHTVVRRRHQVELAENRDRLHRVLDRQRFVHPQACVEERQQRGALTVGVAVDQRLVLLHGGSGDRACRVAELAPQVRAGEVAGDPLERAEEERLVRLDRAAERAAELLAVEAIQVAAVRELAGERLEPLEVEQRAVRGVGARLRDHVDDAAGGAAELCRRAGRDDLEFLDRVERDVDGCALPSRLFPEEPVVVVAAVQADVVEDAALTRERNLVAVRALDDADAWCQGEEVFELPAENRQRLHRPLVERRRRRGPG